MTTQKLKHVAWGFWLDIMALLCGVVYCSLNLLIGYVPVKGSITGYWLAVSRDHTFCSLGAILLFVLLAMIAMRIRRESNIDWPLAAGAFVCVGIVISFFTPGLGHLDKAEINGRVYYLGLESNFELEYDYIVCEYDDHGLGNCHDVYYTKQTPSNQPARFVVNPTTNVLKVQVGDEILYNVISHGCISETVSRDVRAYTANGSAA